MSRINRWPWVVVLTLGLITAYAFTREKKIMWTEVTPSFMKSSSESYGAGDFRIQNGQVLSFRLATPKITFKSVPRSTPNQDGMMWDRVETEPWMRNVRDTLNRHSVVLSQGPVSGPVEKTFEEIAQWSAWWASGDGQVVYIGTQWYDANILNAPFLHKLFKSVDHGKTFKQLDWPEHWDSRNKIRFRNADNGYVVGRGPAIYRTLDGGETWTSLSVPLPSKDVGNLRAKFSVVSLDPASGDLLIGFHEHTPDVAFNARSQVWKLVWGEDKPRHLFTLPGQSIIDMKTAPGSVFVLTNRHTDKEHYFENGEPQDSAATTKELWQWAEQPDKTTLNKLKEFPKEAQVGALYRLASGTLVVDSVMDGKDVVFLSRDHGNSWSKENEGRGAQGVSFDEVTGERYRVEGYSLYKRVIK